MDVQVGGLYKVWLPDTMALTPIIILEKDKYGGAHVFSETGKTFFLEDTNEVKPMKEFEVNPNFAEFARTVKSSFITGFDKRMIKEQMEKYRKIMQNGDSAISMSTRRVLRINGRSYSQGDLDYIGMTYCKENNATFKYASVDGHNAGVRIVAEVNGEQRQKYIYFHELDKFKLYTRKNEEPYYSEFKYVFYRDELEEAAKYFASIERTTFVKFNISHQKSTLVITCRNGLIPYKIDVSLYNVDKYLMGVNMFGRK